MAPSPVNDLAKVRLALVEMRRREAAKIADEGGELSTCALGIFNTMNSIGAVDKAIEDEKKLAPRVAGRTTPAGKMRRAARARPT